MGFVLCEKRTLQPIWNGKREAMVFERHNDLYAAYDVLGRLGVSVAEFCATGHQIDLAPCAVDRPVFWLPSAHLGYTAWKERYDETPNRDWCTSSIPEAQEWVAFIHRREMTAKALEASQSPGGQMDYRKRLLRLKKP